MQYRVLLTAQTPLSFRVGRNTNQSATHPYIPGSSVLGALAQAHQVLGRPTDEFTAFFLQDKLLLSHGYPASFDLHLTEVKGHDHEVLPVPLTARTCKRNKGFLFGRERDGARRAGVIDGLGALALFAMSEETQPSVLAHLRDHPETGYPLDRLDGFFRRGMQAHHLAQPHVQHALRTHVGINYGTGTAHQSVLYSRQVLQTGSVFWGCWWIDDTIAPSFQSFVEAASQAGIIRVGNNRTRGLGRVTCNVAPFYQDNSHKIRLRVEAFTDRVKQAATAVGIAAPAALYIPLLLVSDTIVYDEMLRYRLQLVPTDLEPFGIHHAHLVYHAAGWRAIKGWSAYWGLPKADEWAISSGSVFLFALPTADAAIFDGLLRLQQEHLGVRRNEGFGMIRVAHPFHTDLFIDPIQGGRFQ